MSIGHELGTNWARIWHRKRHSGYTFAAWPDFTVAARAKPGAPELVHGLLETASSFLVSCCLLHGAATQWLPIDRTTFVVAEPWFVVSEEHLADKVTPTAHTGLLEDALQVLLHGMGRDEQLVRDLCRGVA